MLKFEPQNFQALKIIINRGLLDEMLRLFYCLLFPEIRAGGGTLSLEIRAGGGTLSLEIRARKGL